jgi:quinol monooxygenase YgiN
MNKFGMLIKFTAQTGQRDALVEHLSSLMPIAHAEPGTEIYVISVSPSEPDVVWLIEAYSNPQALEAHNANPAILAAKARTGELLAGPPQAFPHIPIVGKGLI